MFGLNIFKKDTNNNDMTYFKEVKEVKHNLNGKEITIKTGQFAHQAHGSVTVTMGETVVLAAATMGSAREGTDFFPMMVDYEEKFYASGKINSNRFMKREGRPSDNAILTARLIDRPLRPLFPEGMNNDVQIICTVLSADLINDASILALNAASAALSISGMPFKGPVGAVRMGMKENGELILNPTAEEQLVSGLDLVVAGTKDAVTMIEAGAKEVSSEKMLEALELAHKYIKEICELQEKLVEMVKPTPLEYSTFERDEEAVARIMQAIDKEKLAVVGGKTKKAFKETLGAVEEDTIAKFAAEIEAGTISKGLIKQICLEAAENQMRENVLKKGIRLDGRALEEIRPIRCEVGVLPRPHGTGVFQRGETQVVSFVTLGSPNSAQIIDSMDEDTKKSYIHHYNFPPYSVGEVKPLRGVGRREIGHGFLAERALEAVIPAKDVFAYTIRVVSETFSCNGSSSMASVCGSTLALMHAGVPIKAPVSGIAMGLITNDSGSEYKILSDIQGLEDFAGDMDFKVAGTRNGITALQMDIKLTGLSLALLKEALAQADKGRMQILDEMAKAIAEPNKELSKYAPIIETIHIDPDYIRDVIGKGGETIQKITADTNTEISIEQDGSVVITAPNKEAFEEAKNIIQAIAFSPEVGQVFEGTAIRVEDYGAFVEIAPGKSGLLHVSKIAPFRVERVRDLIKEGDVLTVKVVNIDDQGRVDLSHKEFYKGPNPETN
jgi:polyribonucleotide nucleotidyltransferase